MIYRKAAVLGDDVDAFGLAADTGPIDALAEAILGGGDEPWSSAGRVPEAPATLANNIDRMFAEERAR